ncbi:ParA family protein [Methylotuvimicrobium sp. KM1]|uniref:ParA family protein n=1 Tax=Methylotuvimicrobium sp. KM1 TaxID=3377707 RepID=UPI00384A881A
MTKIITFYNHKGGVSKTTTAFNVAHFLSTADKRVLVVDADPQCNMTELMLSKLIEELDKEAESAHTLNELPGSTLLSILRPRIDGDVPFIDTASIEVVRVNASLDILRGDVSLNSIEDSLAEAHSQRFSGKIHDKRTYVALGDFLTRLARERSYDVILIDVGPSSGALTRACFLACDAFFIPVAPDRFNVQAIGTLSTIIKRWMKEHAEVYEDFVSLGLPVRLGRPKFLGTISQHFKVFGGKPKPGYRLWMERIPIAVRERLIPVLREFSTPDCNLIEHVNEEECQSVAEIPDFGSLAPLMQEFGKPVYSITRDNTATVTESGKPWGGGTWTDAQERMKTYRERIETIATCIRCII